MIWSYVGGVSEVGGLMSRCAKNASTTTIRIGKAALRKNRLTSDHPPGTQLRLPGVGAVKLVDLAHDRKGLNSPANVRFSVPGCLSPV